MALPALERLRRTFADAHITLVARPWVSGLFAGEGLADEVVATVEARGVWDAARRFVNETRRLRRERFDVAVLLPNSFSAALDAKAAGAKTIIGYPTDGRRWLLSRAVGFAPDYQTRHQVFYYLRIAAAVEQWMSGATPVEEKDVQPRLHVSESEKSRARQKLAAVGLDDARPVVALNAGATNSRAKQWLAERFAQTADWLAERDGFQTVIVGTAGDCEVARRVAQAMRTPAAQLAGETSIAELKAVLACTALLLSNDTGAAHVAAALGVPTVVIFGPTEHFATHPLSALAAVVRHEVECAPCMLRDCPIDHRCMTGVEVNAVYRAAHALLAAKAV